MKKTVLITGASSGIGEAMADVFARTGYSLVITARHAEKLETISKTLMEQYGTTVFFIPADLSKSETPEIIFKQVREKGIEIEILVNNAGFGDFGFFHESDWKKQEEQINLNIKALTHMTHLFVQEMVKRKSGKILNVASTAAFQPGPLMSIYYATKAYVLFFTEGIANELKDFGISVTALCPGPTASNFQVRAEMESSKLFKRKKIPSSMEVAEYGYKSLMKGKTVAIHGTMNYLTALSPRFAPRNMVAKVVRKMQEASR